MRNILLSILIPTIPLVACGTSTPEGGDPPGLGEVSSAIYDGDSPADEVISRAKYWYDEGRAGHIVDGDYTHGYCPNLTGKNDPDCHRDPDGVHYYRMDCSGMASMALHMHYSAVTAGFRDGVFDFERRGSDESARPGDLVLTTAAAEQTKWGNHTIIFERWIDGSHWKGYSGGKMPPSHNTYTVVKSNGTIVDMDADDPRVFHAYRSPHVTHDTPDCTVKSCSKLGLACGKVDANENCGTALDCGGCGSNETCDNGQCQPTVPDAYAKSWWSGKLRSSGECAEISGSDPIAMNSCSWNTPSQDWHLTSNRYLKSDKSGLCLEPETVADGSQLKQTACGSDNQIWRFRHMEIVNGQTGYCADVPMADYHVGQRVIQWPCHGADNQRFKYMPQTGEIRIAGYCLDAGNAANGAQVTLQQCDGTLAQQWNDAHGGFVNLSQPRCLALQGGATAGANANLVVHDCNDAEDQMWGLRGQIEYLDDDYCLKNGTQNGVLRLVTCDDTQPAQTFTFWMND